MTRTDTNRLLNHTGTVHWADDNGKPGCGPVATHNSWLIPTVATVTCFRCIAKFGADEPGHVHIDTVTDNQRLINERAAQRAARRAAREAL